MKASFINFSILGAVALMLFGCAAVAPQQKFGERIAYIQFVDPPGQPGGRISAVDHHRLNADAQHRVRLSPGVHSVGYFCANRIYLHWEPRIFHRFVTGKTYHLSCNAAGEPHIQVL